MRDRLKVFFSSLGMRRNTLSVPDFRHFDIDDAALDESIKRQSVFADNMGKVMEYIDHGAQAGSIILGASNPILSPSRIILDAASKALYSGHDIYSGVREKHQGKGNTLRYYSSRIGGGIGQLSDALAGYCGREGFGDDCIFMATSSIPSGILAPFFDKVLKKGDIVLMTTPTFGPFFSMLDRREILIKTEKLTADTSWKMTPQMLEKMLTDTPDAKAFLFIHPGNPMGEVYSKDELSALAEVFVRHNQKRVEEGKVPLIVISDEVAKNIMINKDTKFTSIATLPGMGDFTLTAWSLSKDQAPGLGVAIGIGPEFMIKAIRNEDTGPPFAMQMGAVQMFLERNERALGEHYSKANKIYQSNVKLVQGLIRDLNSAIKKSNSSLTDLDFVSYEVDPQGGFQFVFNAKGLKGATFPDGYTHIPDNSQRQINSSLDLAWYLRETAKVEFIPGEGFGFDGEEMMFRMTIGKREGQLREAFSRVQGVILKLSISKVSTTSKSDGAISEEGLKSRLDAVSSPYAQSLVQNQTGQTHGGSKIAGVK